MIPVKVIGCHWWSMGWLAASVPEHAGPSMGIEQCWWISKQIIAPYTPMNIHESCNLWHEMRVYSIIFIIFHQSRQCRTNHGSLYNQRLYIPSHIPIPYPHSFVPKISGKHPPPHLRGQGRSLPGWLVVSLILKDYDTSGGLLVGGFNPSEKY